MYVLASQRSTFLKNLWYVRIGVSPLLRSYFWSFWNTEEPRQATANEIAKEDAIAFRRLLRMFWGRHLITSLLVPHLSHMISNPSPCMFRYRRERVVWHFQGGWSKPNRRASACVQRGHKFTQLSVQTRIQSQSADVAWRDRYLSRLSQCVADHTWHQTEGSVCSSALIRREKLRRADDGGERRSHIGSTDQISGMVSGGGVPQTPKNSSSTSLETLQRDEFEYTSSLTLSPIRCSCTRIKRYSAPSEAFGEDRIDLPSKQCAGSYFFSR